MRRWSLVVAAVVVTSASLLLPAVALANFGIHGGYSMDTHTCAGCHRAHTAASSISWTNSANGAAQRAAPRHGLPSCTSSASPVTAAPRQAPRPTCTTVSTRRATTARSAPTLNSGAFSEAVVGDNHHTYDGSTSKAWGAGGDIVMTCGSCHDVHGSSNYRLLKDVVNGVDVGGYVETASGDFLPDPYVISNEPGYPEDGWLLHDAGAAQMAAYKPNYTTPMYATAPDDDPSKGISRLVRRLPHEVPRVSGPGPLGRAGTASAT
jgi:cytochrome c553